MGDEDIAAPGSWPGRTPSPHLKLLGDALKVAYTLATGAAWGDGGLYVIILDSKADWSRGRRTGKERGGLNDSTLDRAHWPPTFARGSCMCRFTVACVAPCSAPRTQVGTFPVRLGGQVRVPVRAGQ